MNFRVYIIEYTNLIATRGRIGYRTSVLENVVPWNFNVGEELEQIWKGFYQQFTSQ